MRADYELFNQQLCILGRNELRIFRGYLSGEKDIGEIAEEEGIQYESAAQRVRRAKVKIKVQMEIKKTAIVPVLVKRPVIVTFDIKKTNVISG